MSELTRRTLLGGLTAGLASTAGCVGFVTGGQSLEFEAEPARVGESTLAETDYELATQRAPTLSREFSVAGQSRAVEVTNHLSLYEKAVDLGPLGSQRVALFAAFATPQIEIADRTFNPVSERSTEELLSQFQSRFEGLTVGEKVGETTVRTLGTDATVEQYDGSVTMQGRQIDVYLHVSRVAHDEDFVVSVGSHPQQLDGEAETVRSLIAGVEH
jgi:hypothetical protein